MMVVNRIDKHSCIKVLKICNRARRLILTIHRIVAAEGGGRLAPEPAERTAHDALLNHLSDCMDVCVCLCVCLHVYQCSHKRSNGLRGGALSMSSEKQK